MTKVFEFECTEPEGPIVRSVYEVELTVDALKLFWERASKYKVLFNQEIRNDFNKFCSVFLRRLSNGDIEANGLMWVVDDFVGVFYSTNIFYPDDADMHYTFLDGRHRGRYELGERMVEYLFTQYGFNRLSAQVPIYASQHVNNFVKRIGFRAEGRKKCTHTYNGKLYDSLLYGIVNPKLLNEVEEHGS